MSATRTSYRDPAGCTRQPMTQSTFVSPTPELKGQSQPFRDEEEKSA